MDPGAPLNTAPCPVCHAQVGLVRDGQGRSVICGHYSENPEHKHPLPAFVEMPGYVRCRGEGRPAKETP